MWIQLTLLVLGFVALIWSADKFLSGAAATATNMGVSKMMIGLTVVSVGTSAPEIVVASMAALDGNSLLAVGNAIGSNIANIGLVLGITAIITPLPFSANVLRKELPWLLGATFLAVILLFDRRLDFVDGIILLLGLTYILWQLMASQSDPEYSTEAISDELDGLPEMTNRQSIIWLTVGLIVLLISAQVLVYAATNIATTLGVSDLIIGLTIVAVGTSLPELAATVGSAIKGQPDIAIGNIVGSNILNILAVLAVPGLIHATDIDYAALWRDSGMMLALTLMLALFAYGLNSRAVITRFEGSVMLMAWIGYNLLLIQQA
ncbi:MAG: calcium/sodium antiporter [Gammaproteobacteria bacterium]|jgi:cation:H+ antiporter|nr:calcium/sodium antiporter [Gammaproteobacteria bacterium]MBT3694360.1 calcium/sodium antiporter [Gammaproteobacteria bacterium]MBT5332617.1 calcium/sodium antiporter [Gammaproteobacteria bacterium]MBT5683260.1 calcium/sodium antiporter [Gammaproteobacteria bacterium]MBT6024067.1 calcium/sodium antiporter [Gammaproteobacteria bacterium]